MGTPADLQAFYQIAERLGVPVAFALLMVVLLIFFARMHRAERGEWREFSAKEGSLNRATIDKLSDAVNTLAVNSAFTAGQASARASDPQSVTTQTHRA